MDIKIEKSAPPMIQINFDEIKTNLTATLTKYSGLVVTEETLSGCKAKQKELAGLRTKIDTYRKDKKKELSEPIAAFENQCKELIALIEKAEIPIKEGIKVFDDRKREEKRLVAEKLIEKIAESHELNEKYAARLDVLEKYCNLTAKESDVEHDLTQRAFALKIEQDREEELLDIVKQAIDAENERIKSKIKLDDFKRFLDNGVSTKDILQEVKIMSERIYNAENPPEPIAEPKNIAEPIAESEPARKEPYQDGAFKVTYEITGTHKELSSVSDFLKLNRITYTVTHQEKI